MYVQQQLPEDMHVADDPLFCSDIRRGILVIAGQPAHTG